MNDRIEDYFNQELPPPERAQFEETLRHDSGLQEEVAFYLEAKQVLREQTLAERHAEWRESVPAEVPVRRLSLWQYAAAAVLVMAMGLAWLWISGTKESTRPVLAAAYVEQELSELPIQMGGETDSLKVAIGNYNQGNYPAALTTVQVLLQRNAHNAEALKLAGLTALRQQNYNDAISYFHRLAAIPDLYQNPGKFYEATALVLRNEPLDKQVAEKLLNEVVSGKLPGKLEAERWLATEAE